MNQLPEAWTLDLTKDELDLYSNLVPDYASGTVKAEFQLRREVMISKMELSDIVAMFKDPEIEQYDDFWFYEDGVTFMVLTGSTPLVGEDEREVYDSLMAKIRKRHREVLVEQIENCKKTAEKLEYDLETYVW